jgi:TQXA domain-containing protein
LGAALLFGASLLSLVIAPVLAAAPHSLRLQGANLATEFVYQPYVLAAGTIDGRHYNFEAGLLGFTDGQRLAGTGYCIDARTHRRHTADYTDGASAVSAGVPNAGPILWLLRHEYPNGPARLGGDAKGLARSSSVVQAAIWHFSDGFELDPAGRPLVDGAYRAAYDQLVAAAAAGAPAPRPMLTVDGPGATPVTVDMAHLGFDVVVRGQMDDGSALPAGTTVLVSSGAAGLGLVGGATAHHPVSAPLAVSLSGGRAVVHVTVKPRELATVRLQARADLPAPPGRVLIATVATQRLVETTWGRETVQAQTMVVFRTSVPTPAPKPTPSPVPTQVAPAPRPVPSPLVATPPVTTVPATVPPPPVVTTPPVPVVVTPPLPMTPGVPSTGHDLRLSFALSLALAAAGSAVLWRSRRLT